MIWNCDNFLRRNTKSGKIYTLSKFVFIQNWLQKKKRHNEATINKIK
jgi:hypothetical protein